MAPRWHLSLLGLAFLSACTPAIRGSTSLDGEDDDDAMQFRGAGSVALDTAALAGVTVSSPSVALTVSGDAAFYCYQVDGGTWSAPAAITTELVVELFSNGAHVLRVAACSAEGTVDEATAQLVSFTVAAPAYALTAQVDAVDPGVVRLSVIDPAVTEVRVALDGGEYGPPLPASDALALSVATGGAHSLRVITRTADSDWADDANAFVFNWSAAAPSVAVAPPPDAVSGAGHYTGTVTSEAPFYRYSLDGGPFTENQPIASPLTVTGLGEGVHVLSVVAVFASGVSSAPIALSWRVDTTPPSSFEVAVTNPFGAAVVNGMTTGGNALTLAVDDPSGDGISFVYTLSKDGGAPSEGSGSVGTAALIPLAGSGDYVLGVRAIDAAGNASAVESYSFTVDADPPTVALEDSIGPASNSPSRYSVSEFALLDLSPVADVARVEWRLTRPDGTFVDAAANTAPGRITRLRVEPGLTPLSGAYTFSVVARDAHSNPTAALTRSFAVDRTPPLSVSFALRDASATEFAPGAVLNAAHFPVSLAFSRSEPEQLVGYVLSRNGSVFLRQLDSEEDSLSFAELPDGDYSLVAVGCDHTGNYTAVTDAFDFSVDKSPPERAEWFGAMPGGARRWQTGSLAFDVIATSPNAAGYMFRSGRSNGAHLHTQTSSDGHYTREGAALNEGGHWFVEVWAVDAAGNPQDSPTRYDWFNDDGFAAHTWAVSETGLDSNSCRPAAPCASLQEAIDKAHAYRVLNGISADQLIKVEAGSYSAPSSVTLLPGIHVLGGFDSVGARTAATSAVSLAGGQAGATLQLLSGAGPSAVVVDGFTLFAAATKLPGVDNHCLRAFRSSGVAVLGVSCVLGANDATAFTVEEPNGPTVIRENTVVGATVVASGRGVKLVAGAASAFIADNSFDDVRVGVSAEVGSAANGERFVVSHNTFSLNSHADVTGSEPADAVAAFAVEAVLSSVNPGPVSSWLSFTVDANEVGLGAYTSQGLTRAVSLSAGVDTQAVVRIAANAFGTSAAPLHQWIDFAQPENSAGYSTLVSVLGATDARRPVAVERNALYEGTLVRHGPEGLCSGALIGGAALVTRNTLHSLPLGSGCVGTNTTLSAVRYGVVGADSQPSEISGNTITMSETQPNSPSVGILLTRGAVLANTVTLSMASNSNALQLNGNSGGVRISANALFALRGMIGGSGGQRVWISRNAIETTATGIELQGGDAGVFTVTDNTVLRTASAANTGAGISLFDAGLSVVANNTVTDDNVSSTSTGIRVDAVVPGSRAVVSDNLTTRGWVGINGFAGRGSTLEVFNNRVRAAGYLGISIVGGAVDEGDSTDLAFVEHNTVSALIHGIEVLRSYKATRARVTSNLVVGAPTASGVALRRGADLAAGDYLALGNIVHAFASVYSDGGACAECSAADLNASAFGRANVVEAAPALSAELLPSAMTPCTLLTGAFDVQQRVRVDTSRSLDATALVPTSRSFEPGVVCAGSGASVGAVEVD